MKDSLSRKLDKNIYDQIILKFQRKFQRKLTENQKKKSNKFERLKYEQIHYTENFYYFEEMVGTFIKDSENQLLSKQNKIQIITFSCNQCLKIFPTKIGLDKHFRTHTGEKCVNLFMCDQCSKVFQSNSDLERHFRIHTGEGCIKLVSCNQCPKTLSYYMGKKFKLIGEKRIKNETLKIKLIKIFTVKRGLKKFFHRKRRRIK